MSGFDRILVSTDFSRASTAAIEYACGLADALDASLCILHTVENPYPMVGHAEFGSLPQHVFDRMEHYAQAHLATALTPEQVRRYRATLVLCRGVAAQEILRYVQEHGDISLIVMATHGRGAVARLMLGSVADKVVRAAPCPVLTIRVPDAGDSTTSRAA